MNTETEDKLTSKLEGVVSRLEVHNHPLVVVVDYFKRFKKAEVFGEVHPFVHTVLEYIENHLDKPVKEEELMELFEEDWKDVNKDNDPIIYTAGLILGSKAATALVELPKVFWEDILRFEADVMEYEEGYEEVQEQTNTEVDFVVTTNEEIRRIQNILSTRLGIPKEFLEKSPCMIDENQIFYTYVEEEKKVISMTKNENILTTMIYDARLNTENITWKEWRTAAGFSVEPRSSLFIIAWLRGEDPTDYKVAG